MAISENQKNSFFASSFYLFIGQFAVILLSILTQVLLARYLMPSNRGIYAMYIVYSSLFVLSTSIASEFGIRHAFIKGKSSRAESFTLLTCVGILGLILVPFISSVVSFLTDVEYLLFNVAVIFTLLSYLNRQSNVILTLDKKYIKSSILAIAEELLKIFALLIVLCNSPSVINAFGGLIVAELIVFCCYFYFLSAKVLPKLGNIIIKLSHAYRYGLKAFMSSLSNLANVHIGVIILSVLLTEYDVGLFVVAFGLASRTQVIPDILNRVVVSRSQIKERTNLSEIKGISSLILFSYMFIGSFVFWWAEDILVFMFGVVYSSVDNVFQIVLCGFFFKVLSKPFEAYFIEIEGRPTVVSLANLFGLCSMSSGLYFGAKSYGLIGAALGICISLVLTYFWLLYQYLKATKISLYQLYHPRNLRNLIS